jgi:hypothetical protein
MARNPEPTTLAQEIERHPGVAKLLVVDVTPLDSETFGVMLQRPDADWDADQA